jgi:hypothetical protein
MADPLSIAASAITLISTCASITDYSLNLLTSLRHAPEELRTLMNEVNDTGIKLGLIHERCLAQCSEQSSTSPQTQLYLEHTDAALAARLRNAKTLTEDLNRFLRSLRKNGVKTGAIVMERALWVRNRPQAERLRKRLLTVKAALQLLLSANTR